MKRPRVPVAALLASLSILLSTALVSPAGAAPLAPGPRATDVNPDGTWTPTFGEWPMGTSGSLVYDPVRNRMLMFGGGLWQLSLGAPPEWTQLSTIGEGSGGPYVYDPNADRILAVMGRWWPDSIQVWELPLVEPLTWHRLPTVGSPASNWFGFRLVFDPATNTLKIFGGSSPDPYGLGPTLIVDWSSNISVSSGTAVFGYGSSGLGARYGHSAIVDAARSKIVVFGGGDRNGMFNDVKVAPLSGLGSWTTPATVGTPPSPRNNHAALYDPVGDRMLVYGGGPGNEVWALALSSPMTWSLTTIGGAVPAPLYGAGGNVAYDPNADRMIDYGVGASDDLWALSLSGTPAWTDYSLVHPAGAYGWVAVQDVASHRMVVHGDAQRNDVWALSFDEPFAWQKLAPGGTPPLPLRRYHAGVYDAPRQRLVIFGGEQDYPNPRLNDVWQLTLGPSPTWSQITPSGAPPTIRSRHAAMYDPLRERMIVFGGFGATGVLNDVWALTLNGPPTWYQITPNGDPPNAQQSPHTIYDPVRDRMLVYGGYNENEVWALTLSDAEPPLWEQQPSCPENEPSPVYDPMADRVLALSKDDHLFEMTLSGTPAWRQMTPDGSGPTSVWTPALFYDPPADRVFAYPRWGNPGTYVLDLFGVRVDVPIGRSAAAGVALAQSYPNPAANGATVGFSLAREGEARLEIFDLAGRSVRQLANGLRPAGRHSVSWDGLDSHHRRVSPGVYVYVLHADGARLSRRIVVTR